MGMTFSEVITYGRLVDKMELVLSIMLPFMGVAVKIGPGMLSFGEQLQQRRPVMHALDGSYSPIGKRVEVTENKGWLVCPPVEFLGEPVQLFFSQDAFSS